MPAGNAFISLDEIITAAAQELGLLEFGALGKPFFVSSAQRGLTDMNYLTNFHKKLFTAEIPESLILEMPDDMTSMDQAYVAKMDGFNITSSSLLFIKPNMFHMGGEGYFAQNKGLNHDALQYSFKWNETPPHHLYFAGERDGKLYLSPSCRERWGHVVIPYVGLGMDCFGEDFQVPMWLREALTDYVIHKAALALERGDPQHLNRVIQRKESELKSPRGSWMMASRRYKEMDKKTRYDTTGYNFRFGHTQ
jgi:hypothetical protein